jgi:very-short-patch-repair endonuclease
MKSYTNYLKVPSRALRSSMTDAECKLWKHLRRKQVHGKQFYRQKPLLCYIVDFYCPSASLVIELDGSQHFDPVCKQADEYRDKRLSTLGLRVLRFHNIQVLNEIEAVLAVIEEMVIRADSNPP